MTETLDQPTAEAVTAPTDATTAAPLTTPAHGLSHLEDEFLLYWDKMATFSTTEAKKLLAWLASKV